MFRAMTKAHEKLIKKIPHNVIPSPPSDIPFHIPKTPQLPCIPAGNKLHRRKLLLMNNEHPRGYFSPENILAV